ncbi:MAG: hypothetical protein ACRD8Z_20545 [Nitrososphaeraceae archaeon]
MIRSDVIACGIVLGAILAIIGVLSTTLPTTVTAQNTTDILTTTKNIHNTTLAGDTIVYRGLISSEEPAHLILRPGEENHGVEILPHRPDGATYSGILTFTATKPVEVGFGHRLRVDNSTLSQFEVEKLGDLYRRHHVNSSEHITPGIISVPSRIIPDYGVSPPYFSASIPFVGSSVFLTTEGEPFVAVYEVVADVLQPQLVVDTDSTKTTSSGTSENVE